MKLPKNYEFSIIYHPGKANVIADALSYKAVSIGILDDISIS